MSFPVVEPADQEIETILKQLTGIGDDHEDVDISGGDHTATMTDCRAIMATTDGAVKVDYTKASGATGTATLPISGGVLPIRNITKVYQTGTTALGMTLVK